MSWQMVEALAELVAAVAVVVSLVYLAVQVRQNTRSVRAATAREALKAIRAWNMHMVDDPDLAQIFNCGLEGMENLDERERARFLYSLFNLFKTVEDLHYQYKAGTLDEETFRSWISLLAIHLKSPGARQYWQARGFTFTPTFQRFYETLETPDVPRLQGLVEHLAGSRPAGTPPPPSCVPLGAGPTTGEPQPAATSGNEGPA